MIDLENADLLTLREASKLLPGRPCVATLHRWRLHGVKGAKLQTIKVGGRRFVDIAALERFIAATTDVANGTTNPSRTDKSREREIQRAERELDLAGITETRKEHPDG